MPRPSRQGEILDAALAVFAEHGYDAARVRQIAARAGVSDAALYRHYPSKEAVAADLFATHMRRTAEAFATIAGDTTLSVEERVKALARQNLTERNEQPNAHAFVLGHQHRFLSALPADFPYPIRILDALLQEGQRDGTVVDGPVRVLSALVLGCLNWPVITAQHARAGAIDLTDPGTAGLIADGAWAAVAAQRPR
ncbi:TetR/AcrR family transcriptional regulator [Conexibacter woesei]|uniref:TetR/AcrR family transcriptional regulator n=1 Tax=Conexibacter woesei TaxID=191495 RepID=UPI0003FF7C35|nr:TetR/AcrR family transcriptional regulator [Conexibacter woesei]